MSNNTTGTTQRAPMGERLRALRLKRRWSMDQLSRKSGVSKSVIGTTERGQHDPSLFSAVCLADALGVTLDYLVNGKTQ